MEEIGKQKGSFVLQKEAEIREALIDCKARKYLINVYFELSRKKVNAYYPVVMLFLVGLGCALGGVLRYLVTFWVAHRCGEAFPWGTLVVNMLGSGGLGFLMFFIGDPIETSPASARPLLDPYFAFFGVGLCGGLTTFSTFSLQTLSLVSNKAWKRVAFNIGGSLLLCLICLLLGYRFAEGLAL